MVEIRRSAKRRRTVQAYREGDTTVVLMPAGLSAAEEQRWVQTMLERLEAKFDVRRPSDTQLAVRAGELSARYLGGRARPTSVQWSDRQQKRWGSCSVNEGSIRLSRRLLGLPEWVIDYVLLHELAHLLVPDHSARFWALLTAYPRAERAKGFLEGVAAADATAPRGEG